MNYIQASGFDTITIDELLNNDIGNKHIAEWTEFSDESLTEFSNMWINPESIDKEAIGIDSEFDFSDVFSYEYMSDKFPGMDPLILNIIVEDAKENKEELLAGFVSVENKI